MLEIIYGIPLAEYRSQMLIIIAGSVMYGLEVVISYILIAFRCTGIQAAIFAVVSAVATAVSYRAVDTAGLTGASWVYFASMTALALCLIAVLVLEMKKHKKLWNTLNG